MNPDEVVAIGAAIQGGVLKGEVKDVLLLDVTPLSLGIETLGGVFTKIDRTEHDGPDEKEPGLSTAGRQSNGRDHSSVPRRTRDGERQQAPRPIRLGRNSPAPRGMPQVEVTFDIDANGIVHVSAKDLATQKEQSIKITASSGLSKEEVEKLVKDAQAHTDEDKKRRRAGGGEKPGRHADLSDGKEPERARR